MTATVPTPDPADEEDGLAACLEHGPDCIYGCMVPWMGPEPDEVLHCFTDAQLAAHTAAAVRAAKAEALRGAIDFAHEEQRRGVAQGVSEEPLTLFQHWSATAGWLASRIRAIEAGDEPDWPDSMNTASKREEGL